VIASREPNAFVVPGGKVGHLLLACLLKVVDICISDVLGSGIIPSG